MTLRDDRSWRWPAVFAGLVVLLGFSVSIAVGEVLAAGQRVAAEQQVDRRADQVRDAVSIQTGRYLDALRNDRCGRQRDGRCSILVHPAIRGRGP